MIRSTKLRYLVVGAAVGALSTAAALFVLADGDGAGSRPAPGLEEPGVGRAAGEMEEMDMGGEATAGMAMDGSIRLTAADVSTFGITFAAAEVRSLTRDIRTVAAVDFDETRMAYVAPKFGGWVERLHVDFTGQRVREGDPLLDVYSPELVTAQEELLLAARMADSVAGSEVQNVAAGAEDLLGSARRRLAYWDVTDDQIERLIETGEVRKALTIHAPVSGIVMEKDVFQGQAFQPGTKLYMIADLSEVWVNAEIFESDVGIVREGMPAGISVAALPGETLSGTVEYVYPTLEDRTRSMRARIAISNPGARLKPGMYATVTLSADLGETLSVPASAVLHSGERAVAFVDMGSGRLMPHELRLGLRGDERVQVLDGLEPGQRVVTSAHFLLDSESNLAEVMKAMMAQMNMTDMQGMDMGGMEMDGMEGMEDTEVDDAGGMRMDSTAPDTAGGR